MTFCLTHVHTSLILIESTILFIGHLFVTKFEFFFKIGNFVLEWENVERDFFGIVVKTEVIPRDSLNT